MNKFISILLICFIFSCNNVLDNTIRGTWSIDSIKVANQEEISCLTINVFHFSEDICSTPGNFCDTFTQLADQKTDVNYSLRKLTHGTYIKFDTNSIFYNDSFRITFFKDTNEKLLKAKLKSENIEIVMRKGMYNFDRNIKTIEKLIEMTN
jgi:hypothetical protein